MLTLTASLVEQLGRLARQSGAREFCGVLIGREGPAGGIAESFHALENRAGTPHRFRFDPKDLRCVEEREDGGDIVAFVHSHSEGDARPSLRDQPVRWRYVIVSAGVTAAPSLRCWRFASGTPREEVVRIRRTDDSPGGVD